MDETRAKAVDCSRIVAKYRIVRLSKLAHYCLGSNDKHNLEKFGGYTHVTFATFECVFSAY
jgi:hypothetical protein